MSRAFLPILYRGSGSHGMHFMPWVRSGKSPRHRKPFGPEQSEAAAFPACLRAGSAAATAAFRYTPSREML